ncbi:MAG: hypothetical protein Q2306_00890 [Phytoplasma sp.]|uniref:hypothetical protein n=1 Tax=Phytoplasma sp. TaxID=2155 RepID=UPI002B412D5D|nr:hypothetical protein [Phytoplasma sp.]WRH06882.1 MAG: hypothetical protein Q2306_00890 [Phytoplasma sp.]
MNDQNIKPTANSKIFVISIALIIITAFVITGSIWNLKNSEIQNLKKNNDTKTQELKSVKQKEKETQENLEKLQKQNQQKPEWDINKAKEYQLKPKNLLNIFSLDIILENYSLEELCNKEKGISEELNKLNLNNDKELKILKNKVTTKKQFKKLKKRLNQELLIQLLKKAEFNPYRLIIDYKMPANEVIVEKGFTQQELIKNIIMKDLNEEILKTLNVSISQLLEAKVTVQQLLEAKVTVQQLLEAKVTVQQLLEAKVTVQQLLEAKVNKEEIIKNAYLIPDFPKYINSFQISIKEASNIKTKDNQNMFSTEQLIFDIFNEAKAEEFIQNQVNIITFIQQETQQEKLTRIKKRFTAQDLKNVSWQDNENTYKLTNENLLKIGYTEEELK